MLLQVGSFFGVVHGDLIYYINGWNSQSFLGLVVVKPFPRFHSQIASVDVVRQEGARPVLGVAKVPVQHLHDEQTSVQSDEVGESQGTHWHVGSQLHCLINIFLRADSLVEGVDGLVDVGHQQAVGDEPRGVLGGGGLLAHLSRQSIYHHSYYYVSL